MVIKDSPMAVPDRGTMLRDTSVLAHVAWETILDYQQLGMENLQNLMAKLLTD